MAIAFYETNRTNCLGWVVLNNALYSQASSAKTLTVKTTNQALDQYTKNKDVFNDNGSVTFNNSNYTTDFILEEVSGYDIYEVEFVNYAGSTKLSYSGSQENTLTINAQSDGGFFAFKTGITPQSSDFNAGEATITVNVENKKIIATFPTLLVTFNITATDADGNNEIHFTHSNGSKVGFLPAMDEIPYFTDIQITDAAQVDLDHKEFTVTAKYNYPMMPGKFYYMRAYSRHGWGAVHYVSDTEANVTGENIENDPKYLWYVVSKGDNTFWLCNVEKEQAIIGINTSKTASSYAEANGSTQTYEFLKTNDTQFRLYWPNSTQNLGAHGNDNNNTANAALGKWDAGRGNGNGTNFEVTEFNESIFNITNGAGEGYVGSIPNFDDFDVARAAYTSSKSAANLKSTLEAYNALDSRIELTANKFYRLRNVGSIGSIGQADNNNKYPYSWLTSTQSNRSGSDRMTMNHDAIPGADATFYYNGSNLISYKTGLYASGNTTSLDAYDWIIEEGENCKYYLKNGSDYLTYWGYDDNGGQVNRDALMKSTKEDWGAWYLQEVTSLPITIAASGYTTFYAPVQLKTAEGVDAYTGKVTINTEDNTGTIEYTKLENGIIPAETAVLLKGTPSTPTILTVDDTPEVSSVSSDIQGGVATFAVDQTTSTSADNYYYTMSGGTFKYFTGTQIPGFKGYLHIALSYAGSQNVKSWNIIFNDDTETSIQAIETKNDNTIYDLQGRRVNRAAKGLYIINGKKVLVK